MPLLAGMSCGVSAPRADTDTTHADQTVQRARARSGYDDPCGYSRDVTYLCESFGTGLDVSPQCPP